MLYGTAKTVVLLYVIDSASASIKPAKLKEIHLILGGYGNENINSLLGVIDNVDYLYLIGDNKLYLQDEFNKFNIETSVFEELEDVISLLHENQTNKVILFSPASQSYDRYNNYIERGEHFNSLVNKYWHN